MVDLKAIADKVVSTITNKAANDKKAKQEESSDVSLINNANNSTQTVNIDETEASEQIQIAQENIEVSSIDDIIKTYDDFDAEVSSLKDNALSNYSMQSFDTSELSNLENTKSSIETNLEQSKSDLTAALNGSHPAISEAQENYNNAAQEYSKALDESNNPQVVALKDQIEKNDINITEQENIVTYCETQIAQTTTQISKQEDALKSLDSEIDSYSSRIATLKSTLSSCTSSKLKDKIQSQIISLEELKGNASARKTDETEVLKTLKNKKKALEKQKPQEEAKLEEFKNQRTDLENQILQAQDAAVNAALENMQSARDNLESTKESLVGEINSQIEQYTNQLSETQTQIDSTKAKQFAKEQEDLSQKSAEEQPETIQSEVYPQAAQSASYGAGGYSNPISSAGGVNSSAANAVNSVTPEQIKQNWENAKAQLANNQQALNDIYDGKNEKLEQLKQEKDNAYDSLQKAIEEVNPEIAKEINDLKQSIDENEKAIDEKDKEISTAQSDLADLQTESSNLDTTLSALKEQLSSLKGTDTSKLDDDKKQELESKISKLEDEISKTEKQKDDIDKKIDDKEQEIDKLKDEKTKLEEDKEKLNSDFEAKTKELESYPDIQKLNSEYKDACQKYDSEKQKAIEEAKAAVASSRAESTELAKTVGLSNALETAQEYKFSANNTDAILDFAKSFIGCKESDGSANKFLNGGSSSATPWCAAYVSYILQNSGEYGNVSSWYKGIDNKLYCPNIFNAAKNANAIVPQEQAQPGDIVLFYNDSKGRYAHVGLVTSIDSDGTVHTIEGNTSDQVAERTYAGNQRKMTFCRPYA